jgi:hypothetical protein
MWLRTNSSFLFSSFFTSNESKNYENCSDNVFTLSKIADSKALLKLDLIFSSFGQIYFNLSS